MFIYFEDNAGVIVNPKGEMKGTLCVVPMFCTMLDKLILQRVRPALHIALNNALCCGGIYFRLQCYLLSAHVCVVYIYAFLVST